jgi:hypothetical protein
LKIQVANLMPYLLLLISAVLAGWGVLGLLEYFFPDAIVLGLQNEKFPAGLQFLHFFSIFVTGAIFIGGYLNRWRQTPFATVVMYAVLATLCFIETVDHEAFGSGATRFIPMVIEYVAYLGFSVYLLRSSTLHHHFCSGSEVAEGRTNAARSGPNFTANG